MNFKTLSLKTVTIIIISVLCGLIYNANSDNSISLIYEPLNLESGSYLTIEQTMTLLKEGRSIFIDTRYKEEFLEGHLTNAINLPANTPREELMDYLKSIPKDQQIVTYCSRSTCNSSRRLAGFLTYLGYKKVYIYLEGYKEWKANNFPIEN
jgi:rhodanese-related sulfurtransferase